MSPWEQIIADERGTLRERLRDRVVVVGFMSSRKDRDLGKDEFLVPVGTMYGAEIHATIAGNLIDGSWIRSLEILDELVVVVLVTLAIAGAALLLPIKLALALVVTLIAAASAVTYLAFTSFNLWIPLGAPTTTAGILTLIANLVVRYLRAQQKVRMNEAFWDFETEP